jgi:hypothetical protein
MDKIVKMTYGKIELAIFIKKITIIMDMCIYMYVKWRTKKHLKNLIE